MMMVCISLQAEADLTFLNIDSVQHIIDSMTTDLDSSLKKSSVSLLSILPRDSTYIPREINYFKFLLGCKIEPPKTVRDIIRKQILIFQLQENMLSSVMVKRSDKECITLLKNIRILKRSKEQLLNFQTKDLWSSDSCK
jgi:hypothetical protein